MVSFAREQSSALSRIEPLQSKISLTHNPISTLCLYRIYRRVWHKHTRAIFYIKCISSIGMNTPEPFSTLSVYRPLA